MSGGDKAAAGIVMQGYTAAMILRTIRPLVRLSAIVPGCYRHGRNAQSTHSSDEVVAMLRGRRRLLCSARDAEAVLRARGDWTVPCRSLFYCWCRAKMLRLGMAPR